MHNTSLGVARGFTALLAGVALLNGSILGQADQGAHLVFAQLGAPRIGLFVADSDGQNERPLFPANGRDYNASFSADGKWIVFTSERGGSADIYRVHPDGSGCEQLTDSPHYDDQASLSPDGQTVAFVSTREGGTANIWVLDLPTRESRNLTRNTAGNFRPSWSPDGQWIAFSSDRDTKPGRTTPSWELLQSTAIYMVHPDGSGLRRLTDLGGYDGSPQWSADGKRLVFYRSTPAQAYDNAEAQIVSLDLETKQIQVHTSGSACKISPRYVSRGDIAYVQLGKDEPSLLFTIGRKAIAGGLRSPCWSPDGQWLVYHKEIRKKITLESVASLDPRFDLAVTPFGRMPSYSPEGASVVLVSQMTNLVIMDADGTHDHAILSVTNEIITFPVWSPDGTQIAFGVGGFFARPVKPGQLALIRPDGSGFRRLTDGPGSCGFASWSPEGKRLVYRVMGHGEQGLRILTLDGLKTTVLTKDYDTFPVWSPRGDRIAFCSSRDGDFDIYTIRPDGSDVRKLTDSHGNDAHAIWSPQGDWLVFSSSRKGFKDERILYNAGPQPYGELFVMRPDGSEVAQLTDNQWEDATPAWRPEPLAATQQAAHHDRQ